MHSGGSDETRKILASYFSIFQACQSDPAPLANNGLGKEVTPQAVRLLGRHQIGTNTPPSQNKNISNLKGCWGPRVSNDFCLPRDGPVSVTFFAFKGRCLGSASVTIFAKPRHVVWGPVSVTFLQYQGRLFGTCVSNVFLLNQGRLFGATQ